MDDIYSRVVPDTLLHRVIRAIDFTEDRTDASPDSEGLQLAFFEMPNEKTFRPHVHVSRPREIPITQECWIIHRGCVLATYYDIDGQVVEQRTLLPGDATITFRGGHKYKSMEDGSRIFEVKTGPFVGVTADKEYLD